MYEDKKIYAIMKSLLYQKEGDFMNYNETVEKVMELLKEKEVCSSSRSSHKDCYASLEQFMEQEGKMYSNDTRDQWLTRMKDELPRQRCAVWEQYAYQLEEMDATGTVSDRRLYLNRSNYEKLPISWRQVLDIYLEDCRSRYTARTLNLTRIYCSEALLFLTDKGTESIAETTYQAIMNLIELEMYCSAKTKSVILVYTARMMRFFNQQGLCPEGFAILLDSQIYPHVGNLTAFARYNQDIIHEAADKYQDFQADEFRETIEPFVETLAKHGYIGTTLKLTRHSLTALFLFLDIHSLGFHPDIMWAWFTENRRTMGHSWRHWRRILKCYEEYVALGDIQPERRYQYAPSSLETLPIWCRQAIEGFLSQKRREFREKSTVRSYQYSCIRFCRFLMEHGYDSFRQLSPVIVKEFANQDTHETFDGRSGCFVIVRGFLRYLEEKGYTADASLDKCLLTRTAPLERITDVLTDEQLQKISIFRTTHKDGIELRDTAIVLLGTRMGLRASDILNLHFEDIDWKKREISIIMKKTRTLITLPMLVDVGNAIYSYISTGRPHIDNKYVFVRSKAPYGKLTGKVCTNALYRILPERRKIKGGGFHVTRRTFATNLLRNHAGIDDVMDALGHRDPTSVMRYLLLDDDRSRSCALSLDDAGIFLEGGLA